MNGAMTSHLLKDAFDHHVWATLRIIDSCLELSPEQLQSNQPGTYGYVFETTFEKGPVAVWIAFHDGNPAVEGVRLD